MGTTKLVKQVTKKVTQSSNIMKKYVRVTPEIQDKYRVPTYQFIMQ